MNKHNLSHKDLVKLGLHESSHGRSLSQIEADFHRMGIDRNDSIRALNDLDSLKKIEERKAASEHHAKPDNKGEHTKEAAGKNKSSFLFWILVLLILLGIGYLFYEGMLSLEILGINLK
ncbi:hypothetical protein HYX06_02760 [Candidatus Woesearchaeota archaeon]|nr:hypothetical protein [Candidatus Woesearchaeota archaeon]